MSERFRTLVYGKGGREHALAWNLNQGDSDEVFVYPGNAGTSREGRDLPEKPRDLEHLAEIIHRARIGLVVIGPEEALYEGLADFLRERDVRVLGVGKKQSAFEASKIFAQEFGIRNKLPFALGKGFYLDQYRDALDYSQEFEEIVIKKDGLARGKGVEVIKSTDPKVKGAAIRRIMMGEGSTPGSPIVIQKRLHGAETSVMGLVKVNQDQQIVKLFEPVADMKEFNGKMSGGIAGWAPDLRFKEKMRSIMKDVCLPTVQAMAREKIDYDGFLYWGLLFPENEADIPEIPEDEDDGPLILEFNVRLGDPETQSLMPLYRNLRESFVLAADGRLNEVELPYRGGATVSLVLASEGYPEKSTPGALINGLQENYGEGKFVFHSGTEPRLGRVVSSGGRTLTLTGYSDHKNHAEYYAKQRAYSMIGGKKGINFLGMQHVHDIGYLDD